MPPANETQAQPAPADVAQPVESVTSGAGNAEPVVDEGAPRTADVSGAGAHDAGVSTATGANPGTHPADVAQPKAAEPPAQAGDEAEVKVAKAEPVLLPSEAQGKAELDANPARTSVLTDAGHLVRE